MLNEMYPIGKKINLITKYNILYDRRAIFDFICAIHLQDLIDYAETDNQKATL